MVIKNSDGMNYNMLVGFHDFMTLPYYSVALLCHSTV